MNSTSLSRAYRVAVAWLKQAPYLSIAVMAGAVFMTYELGLTSQQMMQNLANAGSSDLSKEVRLEKTPVSEGEYRTALTFCKDHIPDVSCALSNGKLIISIASADKYTDWIFALSTLQAYGKDMVWDPKYMCVGDCGGTAATAELIAYNQKIQINDDVSK